MSINLMTMSVENAFWCVIMAEKTHRASSGYPNKITGKKNF